MSGGSYDYFYYKIQEFADQLVIRNNPQRMLFKQLLELVAKAAHDIEWVDSGDYGENDENKAIDACFNQLFGDIDLGKKARYYDMLKDLFEKME